MLEMYVVKLKEYLNQELYVLVNFIVILLKYDLQVFVKNISIFNHNKVMLD